MMIKRFAYILFFLIATFCNHALAQRKMEDLGRGLVAVKVNNGVFLSWRILGTEWYDVTYNVYSNGSKLNAAPLEVSNFNDLSGTLTTAYTVSAVVKGIEQPQCKSVIPLSKQYKEIELKTRNTSVYQINDATAADLDGDGEYEIIVKRVANGWNENNTSYTYFEAYKLDGTFLWEINVGPNILPDVEINIAAFDFDGDGKAEVFMRSSEGTIFGDGTSIGDTDNDGRINYRYSVGTTANMQFMNAGPEFLSLIDGITGAELDRINYIPRGQSSDWGDSYGHRASKYFFGAPYLDGQKTSLFIGRGIYTKTIMRTYDVVNKKMVLRWEFNSGNSGPYYGQGNHNYTIADVDGDGRDEIVWGSMTVDDDGTGLYSTQLGHGDALHVGDLDPFRKGTEIFKCLEESPNWGTALYDGATGEILIHHLTTSDCGRACAANISDNIKGNALWGGSKMFSASTHEVVGTSGGPENYRIYWDGDLLEEMTDHSGFSTSTGYGTGAIYKYGSANPVLLASGATSCNYTKGTPSLQADLFGDWREEVIWRNTENTAIRIYTTIDPTIYRNYTLMHDHQYRQAIAWQMCGYNQPPHASYFLGKTEGKTVPPPPAMSNNRLVYKGTGTWDKTAVAWNKDGTDRTFADGEQVLFGVSAGTNVSVALNTTVSPDVLTVNSPGNYTLTSTNGRLNGAMRLVKQGNGSFTFNGVHDYSGKTEVWGGLVNFNGELTNSHVWLEFFGEMNASGKLDKGATLRYGSVLNVGGKNNTGKLIVEGPLTMGEQAGLGFDLFAPASQQNDSLILNGNLSLADKAVFLIEAHPAEGKKELALGEYLLMKVNGTVSGDLSKIEVKGLSGTAFGLKLAEGKIILVIKEIRQASMIIWNGGRNNDTWDLALTRNFLNSGVDDFFVTADNVVFNDASSSKVVNISGEVNPASVYVNAATDYIFSGTGKISGTATLKKSGTGKLIINNINDFTGKVIIKDGTLEVSKMPTEQAPGAIGIFSKIASDLEIDGGTLRIIGDGSANRAALLGVNGGTIENSGKFYWHEAFTGETLIKTGTGNLLLGGANTHSKTILKQGTLSLFNDASNPGKTVVLEGGILQFYNDMYSYSTINCNIEIPGGKTTVVNLDSRATYNGTLTGAGTVTMNIPNVRSEFKGNWSAFEGKINFVSTYSNSNGYYANVRLNNSYGLAKAAVNLGANVTAYNLANSAFAIGELTGSGELSGAHNWIIGSRNTNATFNGTIIDGSINKVGDGSFTLTAANTYTGNTKVENGTLILANISGSATGSGTVTVQKGATLMGNGSLAGNLIVESSGALAPGLNSVGKLTVGKGIIFNQQSYYSLDINIQNKEADQVETSQSIQINGFLYINTIGQGSYAEGDQFQILKAANISGNFQMIVPSTPGDGLKWDTSELNTKGLLKVAIFSKSTELNTEKLNMYPNPVDKLLYIDAMQLSGNINITIFDMAGKEYLNIDKLGGSIQKIDLLGFEKGVYIVSVGCNGEVYSQKINKY